MIPAAEDFGPNRYVIAAFRATTRHEPMDGSSY
jgi:hypothetical protein